MSAAERVDPPPMMAAALEYAARGWAVLPCLPGAKEPCGRLVPHGHRSATTDPETIRRWWTAEPSANVAIALAPSGLVAVDVDDHKPDCEWYRFIAGRDIPATWRQRTGRGGTHLVFTAPDGAAYPGTLCSGVDIKRDGYILAEPSVVDGKPYIVQDDDDPAPVPDWVPPRRTTDDAPPDITGGSRPEADNPVDVIAALAAIPNHADWDEWNRIGMATWRATGGSAAGYAAFAAWSSTNPKYDPADCHARWHHYSTSPPTELGAGTLFYMARQAMPGWRKPSDHNAALHGAAVAEALTRPAPGFPLVWFGDIEPALDTIDFVEGVLLDGGLTVIYGESNCGKTFFTLDMALHVAAGAPWQGRDVEQGAVIYVAAEGGFGIRNRVSAARAHYNLPADLPFAVVASNVNMLHPTADIPAFLDAIERAAGCLPDGLPVRLVVVDTLSRAMSGGNENASEDMGALVRNADRVRAATGANLAFIHHSGKDRAAGARGHSLLRAATDTEIEVAKDADSGIGTATIQKQRDMGGVGDTFGFELIPVELGTNGRGKPVTSCTVCPVPPDARPKSSGLSAADRHALGLLSDEITRHGETAPASDYIPQGVQVVDIERWRERFYATRPDDETETKKKAFQRVRQRLIQSSHVGIYDPYAWVAKNDD